MSPVAVVHTTAGNAQFEPGVLPGDEAGGATGLTASGGGTAVRVDPHLGTDRGTTGALAACLVLLVVSAAALVARSARQTRGSGEQSPPARRASPSAEIAVSPARSAVLRT
ncbi:hypothetical protein [Actinoplanes sp. ATCC 53533]|uniref:hypothetical protein n=1 Tax=Actinoplanes sp. ATCC 53533 TaxID=1288362 RepID=UPI000F76FABF|nr:hypothetical protein [Actinoplanes sp. ATCC 53533]